MSDTSTIQISRKLKEKLDSFKDYNRETYAEVINRLVELVKEDEESKLELSEKTLEGLKEAGEDLKKGRVYTTRQMKKELGL